MFIGSNKEKLNFNTFDMPLNFLLNIYNGTILLKEVKFKQRDLEIKITDLQFDYTPKNEKEKEEIDEVLMQAKNLLESWNKIIDTFKDDSFLSEYLKKSDDVAYNYVLKNLNKFTEEIKSMEEKIYISLFKEFFEYSSPAQYAKELINIKNQDKNKEIAEEIKNKISDLEDKIKQMNEKVKEEKNVDETIEIINKILNYNKNSQFFFHRASKVDNKKSESKFKESIVERRKLRRQKDKEFIENIENKSKTINYNLFKDYFKFESPTALTEQLYKIKNKNKNDELVNVTKSGLIDLKDEIEKMSKEEKKIKKPNGIVNIVEEILEFNRKKQSGGGLKVLTPDQMLSRLPITLAQLKAGNNSEKLKNETFILFFVQIKKTYKTTL